MDQIENSSRTPAYSALPSKAAKEYNGNYIGKSADMNKAVVRDSYRYFIMICAVVGLAIMTYLTYIHYANVKSFCDISAEVSCDVVTTSIYSEIFGIPVSVLGLLYFAAILFVALAKKSLYFFQLIFFATIFALIPSLYLTLTEVLFIKSFCVLCETSKAIMFIILITSFFAIRSSTPELWRLIAPFIIAGVVSAGVMYFAQTGTVAKKDYSELVSRLNEAGWVYYKSYTCSQCRRQEKLLGDAYKKLNAVECHPDGPSGNPELCLQKNITKTPTWILERDGVEVRRVEGLQSIEELMTISGYVAPVGAK